MRSNYLLSLRWPENARSIAVPDSFELGSLPSARAWVPSDVLEETTLHASSERIVIKEDAAGPTFVIGGKARGSDWTSGPLSLSIARLPEDLKNVDSHGLLKGDSLALRRLLRDVRLASTSDASVLIQGETGTGKEVIARTLHDLSPRSSKPYVVIDCTAISETLFESELFGHVKGSYSGANVSRIGPFEEADGGTVLIDEIGEIPLAMQPKLLRVLESGTVRRVGENTHRKVDVRVIGATHRDLHKMVQEGAFRGDLYYRLAVLELRSPPLRERHGDLAELLRLFVSDELVAELDGEQWEAIETHPWLGNIRELRNFAQRAATHGWSSLFDRNEEASTNTSAASSPQRKRGPRSKRAADPDTSEIALPEAPIAARQSAAPPSPDAPTVGRANDPKEDETLADFRARWVHEGEGLYLRILLRRAKGSITQAAKIAGVDRTHLHRILRKHGLSKAVERGEGQR